MHHIGSYGNRNMITRVVIVELTEILTVVVPQWRKYADIQNNAVDVGFENGMNWNQGSQTNPVIASPDTTTQNAEVEP